MNFPIARAIAGVCCAGVVGLFAVVAHGQMPAMAPGGRSTAPEPIRTTMSDLHAHGGVPPGWTFLMPRGDVTEGRKVFVTMECFACHEVKGEAFPATAQRPRGSGPELTGMGSHHPAEYFAESIVNPNRVIVQGPGFTGADRLSTMPSYADSMTVRQLVDVVAYLQSLTSGETAGRHHDMGGAMKMGDSKMK